MDGASAVKNDYSLHRLEYSQQWCIGLVFRSAVSAGLYSKDDAARHFH